MTTVKSFEELGALYQRKLDKANMGKGTITNQAGVKAELNSYKGTTILQPDIPLRRF